MVHRGEPVLRGDVLDRARARRHALPCESVPLVDAGDDEPVQGVAGAPVVEQGAAAAERFVVGVGGDDQDDLWWIRRHRSRPS